MTETRHVSNGEHTIFILCCIMKPPQPPPMCYILQQHGLRDPPEFAMNIRKTATQVKDVGFIHI